jgi:hypothetical protein
MSSGHFKPPRSAYHVVSHPDAAGEDDGDDDVNRNGDAEGGSGDRDLPSGLPLADDASSSLSASSSFPESWLRELRPIVRLGWPTSLNQLLAFTPGMFAVSFLSDPDEIAAAGLGFFVGNVVGVSLVVGFGSGFRSVYLSCLSIGVVGVLGLGWWA